MKQLTIIGLVLSSLIICRAQSNFVILQDQKTVEELISIFKVLPEFTMATTLSTTEFDAAKHLLTKCIADYNDEIKQGSKKRGEKKGYARMYQIKSLTKYKVQFVPYLNEKGEKEIWINGFCSDHHIDWRTEIVHAFDGGNCYFTVRLNLSNNKCLAVGTNGYS